MSQQKIKIYLETSILNFYYAHDSPDWQRKVKELFKIIRQNKKYQIFISDLVIKEIQKAEKDKSQKLQKLIKIYQMFNLQTNKKIQQLTKNYLKSKIVPLRYKADAQHIAIASYYKMDAIISLNFEHIVKLKTIKECNLINTQKGFPNINIITPEQIIYENE